MKPPLWLDVVEKAHNQFTALYLQMWLFLSKVSLINVAYQLYYIFLFH